MEPPLDPPCNPKQEAAWEHHMETCENCLAMESIQHLPECRECYHMWHELPCEEDGCECEETDRLSERQIDDLKERCFQDEQSALYADYIDRKVDEWRDRNL